MSGKVFLVGAGPGDPGLLTIRALEIIEEADVILFDQLVDERIGEHFPTGAEKIFVGKEGGKHHVTQDETLSLMKEKAKAGARVLRLKGGDPFVFGRGGEEAEACAAEGIPFEVVPGVTAGVAAPAYAGIPVTHRDCASSVAFITGHRRGDKEDLEVEVSNPDTLVFYMGVKNLPRVVKALIGSGRKPQTPAALIHRGTTPAQKTVAGTLENIVRRAKEGGINPPAVFVVGEVVRYGASLRWFESRPLFNRTVLITRPKHQARELRRLLERKGAQVISAPAIEIEEPPDFGELDRAVDSLEDYDYLVFTSVNGVTAFFKRLFDKNLDARALAGLATVCIGPRTAAELEQYHVKCDRMPKKFVAEELLEVFPQDLKGKRVLIPRALEAREVLPQGLRDRGARVDVVPAYVTRCAKGPVPLLERVDVAVFTSSSAVDHFLKRVNLPAGCRVASIGPITTRTLGEHGLNVDAEAEEHTIPGLVRAIEELVKSQSF